MRAEPSRRKAFSGLIIAFAVLGLIAFALWLEVGLLTGLNASHKTQADIKISQQRMEQQIADLRALLDGIHVSDTKTAQALAKAQADLRALLAQPRKVTVVQQGTRTTVIERTLVPTPAPAPAPACSKRRCH